MEEDYQVDFYLPENTNIVDTLNEILTVNGLAESAREFFEKETSGQEPKSVIVYDAAISLAEERAPENVITDLLAKHLETSPETAANIVAAIKRKLLPYAEFETDEDELEEDTEETDSDQFIPYGKKIEIKNVEENAAALNVEKEIQKAKTVLPQEPSHSGPDSYREEIT